MAVVDTDADGAGRVHDVAYAYARDEHGWWPRLEEADPAVGTAD